MNIFLVPSSLTTIKNMSDAESILRKVDVNNTLLILVDEGEYIEFSKDTSTFDNIYFREIKKNSTPFNMVSIQYSIRDASKILYKFRKYYNEMFRD